jgi:hypothetical protein
MAAKKSKAPPAPPTMTVKVGLRVSDATATFYVNNAEVGSTTHDFTMMFSQMPAKVSPALFADAEKTGTLTMDASVQVVFPLTLMAGLIRALTAQKEAYEKSFGVILSEPAATGSSTHAGT